MLLRFSPRCSLAYIAKASFYAANLIGSPTAGFVYTAIRFVSHQQTENSGKRKPLYKKLHEPETPQPLRVSYAAAAGEEGGLVNTGAVLTEHYGGDYGRAEKYQTADQSQPKRPLNKYVLSSLLSIKQDHVVIAASSDGV